MLTKRVFLTTASGTIALLGLGGSYIATKSIEAVREPWRKASNGFGDPRLDALAYAILAPSPHNRQPWLIELKAENVLTLYCDLERLLPETDPYNRQITIGLGAFLELFRQASAEVGYRVDMELFPEGEPQPLLDKRPIAHIKIIKDEKVKTDPLFEYALYRRTARVKFKEKIISEQNLLDIKELARVDNFNHSIVPSKVKKLKYLCKRGWKIETNTPKTHHETTMLTRIGADEINQKPDGVSLHGVFMETLGATGVLTREKYATKGTMAFNGGLSFYNDLIESAPSFGWLYSDGNSRKAQIQAGMDWIRLNLASTKLGIAMHPLSQTLQEFPEMSELYKTTHQTLDVTQPNTLQGLFRFGFADTPKAAPRWPLRSILIEA